MTLACGHVQQQMQNYWELEADDPQLLAIDAHIAGCAACAEQFRLWEESVSLIRTVAEAEAALIPEKSAAAVNASVMSRIYAEDGWLLPPARRAYAPIGSLRRRIVTSIACLLALCGSALLLMLYDHMHHDGKPAGGVMQAAGTSDAPGSLMIEMPLTRVSDPFVLNTSPVAPEYWVMLSVLGIFAALLIMNWYSRLRKA
ncbi:hypothetical protein [Cohnella sp. 56]|uniref:hypothetical protein n=1 Tax=Cohnella sp. 56 TaxID=3113722 RepID=UPI0030E7BD9A